MTITNLGALLLVIAIILCVVYVTLDKLPLLLAGLLILIAAGCLLRGPWTSA
jgi:multisubunit Na+/H+ antiporter MnhG subunit